MAERPSVPVISEGPYGFPHLNVAMQRRDTGSLLNWIERLIRMRKEVPEIGWGDYEVIPIDNPAILLMRYSWRNNAAHFIHNLGGDPCEVTFPAGVARLQRRASEPAGRGPQRSGRRPPAPRADGALRLSLVPRRRAGLPAGARGGLSSKGRAGRCGPFEQEHPLPVFRRTPAVRSAVTARRLPKCRPPAERSEHAEPGLP